MKRLLALLIISAICLSLSACSQKPESVSFNESDFSELMDKASVIVDISINPQFKVLVNESGVITGVHNVNDDAKSIFGAEFLKLDMSFNEGLQYLFEKAFDKGFVNNQNDVKFEITSKDNSVDPTYYADAARDAVTEFMSNNNINAGFSVQINGGQQQEESKNDNPTNIPLSDDITNIQRDESGAIIYTQRTESDGSTVDSYYDGNGTLTHLVHSRPDGFTSEQHFDEKGQMISDMHSFGDGSNKEYLYDNGKIVSEFMTFDPSFDNPTNVPLIGNIIEVIKDPNGNIIVVIDKDSAGTIGETHYTPSGTLEAQRFTFTDDTIIENFYNPDGTLAIERTIDPSGNISEINHNANQGNSGNDGNNGNNGGTMGSDGSNNGKVTYPIQTRTDFADGSYEITTEFENGYKQIRLFDSNGQELSMFEYDPNGALTARHTYDPVTNTIIREELAPDGSVMNTHVLGADGAVIGKG